MGRDQGVNNKFPIPSGKNAHCHERNQEAVAIR